MSIGTGARMTWISMQASSLSDLWIPGSAELMYDDSLMSHSQSQVDNILTTNHRSPQYPADQSKVTAVLAWMGRDPFFPENVTHSI